MKTEPLTLRELALIESVFSRHPEVRDVTLFGSRAKGTHAPNSDIDLSIRGDVNALQTEALALELDELPLPYRFDVLAYDLLKSKPHREHIERVGIVIYPSCHA
jgi:predicted nucleotidyltransferase